MEDIRKIVIASGAWQSRMIIPLLQRYHFHLKRFIFVNGKAKVSMGGVIIGMFLFSFSQANAFSLGGIDFGGGGSGKLPEPAKLGLPFESSGDATRPIVLIIKESIKYVGLLAILALSWGGIQFLISMGNDEQAKHAKHTIIYALVGVILSVAAYTIIDIVNSLRI